MSVPNDRLSPERNLTADEIRAELARVKPGATDALGEAIAGHAKRSGQHPRELLNEVIARALTTRAIPADVAFEAVLAGIARSIASGINIARARGKIVDLPVEELFETLPVGGYIVSSPDEIIERERIRQLCADAIERLARNDAKRAALIDAIDQGMRGEDLADALEISKRDLASMRKALKREVQRIWPEVAEQIAGV
ncbi:MAG: hypothetical protein F9K30_22550 [Dechloromonas sp.]|nr:MAG: hypothetical protein F9K30_22550 [Dechloromonas sp.]